MERTNRIIDTLFLLGAAALFFGAMIIGEKTTPGLAFGIVGFMMALPRIAVCKWRETHDA